MTGTSPLHAAHVAAVRAAQAGDTLEASALFQAAPADAKRDARFLADHAAFAMATGDPALAASLYARAITATPGDAPPLRLRHALAVIDAGQVLGAIDLLAQLTRDHPRSAMAWQAYGAALHAADRAADALAAFDQVVQLAPGDPLGRLSRARMLDELGKPAIGAFADALAAAPDNRVALLGLAAAQANGGRPDLARATLLGRLAEHPDWAEGWAAMASFAYRWEGRAASLAAIDDAFKSAPRDQAVATTMLRSMAAMGAADAVLAVLPNIRASIGDSLPLVLIEAQAASETGKVSRADAAFARLGMIDDPIVLLARVRHALRAGRPDAAVTIGLPMLSGEAARFAIPYLGAAWRLLDDPRHYWLEGDPRLVGSYDLKLAPADLRMLADELRTLHNAHHAPFEQSVRGGTQTEGMLLSRQTPAIRNLRVALARAVRAHIDQLPAADAAHPTLSVARGVFRFSGSWSVRLTGGGHHVNHVHSEGWFSSACYIALPAAMKGGDEEASQAGWLALGQPPVDLALDLPPHRTVRPIEGQVVLFPSTMWHGTHPAPAGERLTVAFDVQPLA